MSTRSRVRVLGTLVVVVALAACTDTQGVDKAGGETTILTLASIDDVNNNGQSFGPQAFVNRLGELSGGRLKVEVKTEYGGGAPDGESNLVKAIAGGDVDGGWPSTRAFTGAGIAGFDAVEAPLTITSYQAQRELVVAPVADALLGRLDGTGVLGLGLAVGPLRRPFAVKAPLLGPSDWVGQRFRTYNSPVQEATVHALGGTPVNLGFGWVDEARAGRLRGVEFDVAQYAKNGNPTSAGNVTANVVLWPKVFVMSINRKRFDSLSRQQQDWIRRAAKDATQASVDAKYDESSIATELCGQGVRFVNAQADQISALRTKIRPVIQRLAADPEDGPILKEIQAIGSANPAVEVPTVPIDCQGTSQKPTELGQIPAAASTLPEGIYRVELSKADYEAVGLAKVDGLTGTWTLTVRNSRYQLGCRPLDQPGVDCAHEVQDRPFEVGDLRGTGNTVYFVYRPDRLAQLTGCRLPASSSLEGHCFAGENYRMNWKVEKNQLTFSDYVSDWTNPQYLVEPWQKIG
jgi:TRAP-type C4-dicarboxylate transport system substrate-binding protein